MASGVVLTRYDIWDLNNDGVPAFPVQNPPGWDDISLYYAKALQKMGWKNPPASGADVETTWKYSEDPTSYYFQAAMHWTPKWPRTLPPAPFDESWNHCTHGPASAEKYFLPWHRAYIYWFEAIVRSYVADLGGPGGWALPYWNYSYYDESDPESTWPRSKLPFVFCQPTLPDGTGNPLYIGEAAKRGLQPRWPDTGETMFLEALTPYYHEAYGQPDFYGFNKTLDGEPHGAVHVDVGSGNQQVSTTGWMRSTVTAAFDPIFWLHHAEIDRFWVGWNASGNRNPTDSVWLAAEDDPQSAVRWFFWRDGDVGNKFTVHPGQLLDPANLPDPFPYSYRYQNLPQMPAPLPPGRRLIAAVGAPSLRAARAPIDPVLATADMPVELGKEPMSISLTLSPETPQVLEELRAAPEEAPRVMLHLDDVVAEGPPGNYEVYLNYPDANQETAGSVPHYVGLLAGFGTDHHHDHADHQTHGLSFRYDITELVDYLESAGEWDESQLTLSFVPAARPRGRELQVSPLRVGSVNVGTV
jgi:tyrosinase